MFRFRIVCRACVAAALLAAGAPARAQEPPAVVVVIGEGLVTLAPDVAHVVFVAQSRNASPRVAQRDAATAMTAVHAALDRAGLAADARQTSAYELEPEYDYSNDRRVLTGYVSRNRLEVRVDDLARLGELIDAAVQAGATSVEGLQFDVKDRAEVERLALRAASADAWSRAQAAAAGVGREVDRVLRIEEPGAVTQEPMRPVAMMRAVAESAPVPPIVPGVIEIRARVTLTATLK